MSIVEACRQLDIPMRDYRGDILPALGQWPVIRITELAPPYGKDSNTLSQ